MAQQLPACCASAPKHSQPPSAKGVWLRRAILLPVISTIRPGRLPGTQWRHPGTPLSLRQGSRFRGAEKLGLHASLAAHARQDVMDENRCARLALLGDGPTNAVIKIAFCSHQRHCETIPLAHKLTQRLTDPGLWSTSIDGFRGSRRTPRRTPDLPKGLHRMLCRLPVVPPSIRRSKSGLS